MKKVSLLIAAFALVLGFSQCRKPNMPALNGETQHVVLNASWDNGGSKIEQNGSLLKWTTGDKLTVSGGATGELSCKDATLGTFEGTITKTTGESITFTFQSEKYKEDLMEQTGYLNDAIKLLSDPVGYQPNGDYDVVEMKMSGAAVLKLDLSYFAPSPSKADVTVNISVKAEGKDGSDPIASVKCASDKLGEVYVAVPAKETPATYTFSDGSGKTVEMSWPALFGNTFFTAGGNGGAAVIDTPKFTVAAGTTVEFAPGNLYWDGSAFHFEADQWSSAKTWKANHVSHFFWSKSASVAYAGSYSGSGTSTSDVFFTNSSSFQVDGETAGTWRTLTRDEWNYLLGYDPEAEKQTDTYGRLNAMNLCAWKELDGHKGLVILPDGTENPSTVMSGITSTSHLATSGAVFLPAAGKRVATSVRNAGSDGLYWSSTPQEGYKDNAFYMYFYADYVRVDNGGRLNGYSVRLVR